MELKITHNKGVTIQDDLIGIFFEDINYGADGGLYAEMLENRSFEFLDARGALVSYPGYDINKMANGVDAEYYAK